MLNYRSNPPFTPLLHHRCGKLRRNLHSAMLKHPLEKLLIKPWQFLSTLLKSIKEKLDAPFCSSKVFHFVRNRKKDRRRERVSEEKRRFNQTALLGAEIITSTSLSSRKRKERDERRRQHRPDAQTAKQNLKIPFAQWNTEKYTLVDSHTYTIRLRTRYFSRKNYTPMWKCTKEKRSNSPARRRKGGTKVFSSTNERTPTQRTPRSSRWF